MWHSSTLLAQHDLDWIRALQSVVGAQPAGTIGDALGESSFSIVMLPECIAKRMWSARPCIMCSSPHLAAYIGLQPAPNTDGHDIAAAAPPPVALEEEEPDADADLVAFERAFPVSVIIHAVMLSYKLHNPKDLPDVVKLAAALVLLD